MPTKLTNETFIDKSTKIHGNKYDYTLVNYQNAFKQVEIICQEHGSFYQTPRDHLQKCGCPLCAKDKLGNQRRKSEDAILKEFFSVHGDKYDYSNMHYKKGDANIEVICKKHGAFFPTALNHLKGSGCPLCYRSLHTLNGFIERASSIHGGKYDYSLVPDAHLKHSQRLLIICPSHGIFEQSKRAHLMGHGCTSCRHYRSKAEKEWLKSLNITDLKHSYIIPKLKFNVDGYSPSTNTVYEFYGDFWHANPSVFNQLIKHPKLKGTYGDVYFRTMERERKITQAGYNIVTIWESDWNRVIR